MRAEDNRKRRHKQPKDNRQPEISGKQRDSDRPLPAGGQESRAKTELEYKRHCVNNNEGRPTL